MSSNDRYNRSNRPRQAPVPDESIQEDDVVNDDQWDFDSGVDDISPPRQQTRAAEGRPQSSRQQPMSGTPSVDGTAAQIDRLRRNIRQSTRPSTRPPTVQNTRRASQQPPRHALLQEDQIVTDNAYFDDENYQSSARPERVRAGTFPSRKRAADQPTFDEPYDGDPYVDDDGFEDDFSEYDAPRRPERQARPKPQLTMPTISRPSLPPAIARADLVNDAPALGIIGAGLASLAGMAIVVANQAESLTPEFATHVSASGVLENFKDDSALWNVPLMAAMFTLMNIVMAWFISPLDRFASRFILVGAIVAQVLAWVAIVRIL